MSGLIAASRPLHELGIPGFLGSGEWKFSKRALGLALRRHRLSCEVAATAMQTERSRGFGELLE